MTDLPLPRIGQAIRAVLDDLYLLPVAYGRSDVVSKTRGWCHQGTHDEARAYIDAWCAEAAVRAMVPAELVALSQDATPGRWHWWTSNSWLRLGTDARGYDRSGTPYGQDGYIAYPYVSRSDNHPDLCIRNEADRDLIPAVVNWLRSLIPATTSETQP